MNPPISVSKMALIRGVTIVHCGPTRRFPDFLEDFAFSS